jgi:hypothetical protein
MSDSSNVIRGFEHSPGICRGSLGALKDDGYDLIPCTSPKMREEVYHWADRFDHMCIGYIDPQFPSALPLFEYNCDVCGQWQSGSDIRCEEDYEDDDGWDGGSSWVFCNHCNGNKVWDYRYPDIYKRRQCDEQDNAILLFKGQPDKDLYEVAVKAFKESNITIKPRSKTPKSVIDSGFKMVHQSTRIPSHPVMIRHPPTETTSVTVPVIPRIAMVMTEQPRYKQVVDKATLDLKLRVASAIVSLANIMWYKPTCSIPRESLWNDIQHYKAEVDAIKLDIHAHEVAMAMVKKNISESADEVWDVNRPDWPRLTSSSPYVYTK